MGTWNAGLFSNDTTLDVRDTYMELLKQQLSNEEAYKKTYKEYEELIGDEEEPLFWYALADTQWNVGRLMPEVKKRALDYISVLGGVSLWEETPKRIEKWKNTLKKLEDKLNSEMPPEKEIKPPIKFITNPWNVGDIYAYQLHGKSAEKYNMLNKYMVIQKIGDYMSFDLYSVVRVFNKVFDNIPELKDLESIDFMPLFPIPEVDGLIIYKEAYLAYYNVRDYTKKYYHYIGTQKVPVKEFDHRYLADLSWRHCEDWLTYYYNQWNDTERVQKALDKLGKQSF